MVAGMICRASALTRKGANMVKTIFVVLLLAQAGCSNVSLRQDNRSPCSVSEASYECQVERYDNINVQ
jgi:hypothetical protein